MGLPEAQYYASHEALPDCNAVLECVGKPNTLATALHCAAPNGRVVTVGNPNGDIVLTKADYWKILRNQLTVLGTWNSSFKHDEDDDWHLAIKFLKYNAGMFSSILSHQLSLQQLDLGLKMMRDKTEPYSKVIVISGEEAANRQAG